MLFPNQLYVTHSLTSNCSAITMSWYKMVLKLKKKKKKKMNKNKKKTVRLKEQINPKSNGNVQIDYKSSNSNSQTHAAHAPVKKNTRNNLYSNISDQTEHPLRQETICFKPKDKYIHKRLLRRKKMKKFQVVNNSVTYVPADKFSHDEEETLPDINEEIPDSISSQSEGLMEHKIKDNYNCPGIKSSVYHHNEKKIRGTQLKSIKTGKLTHCRDDESGENLNRTGREEKTNTEKHTNKTHDFIPVHTKLSVSGNIIKARKRLSVSLKNASRKDQSPGYNETKKQEFVDIMSVPSSTESTSSLEMFEENNPTKRASQFIFNPIGAETQRTLSSIFKINMQGPLPKYSGINEICDTFPKRIKYIKGDGNCLFNSISYVLCSDIKFHWNIRQKLCDYIEKNWRQVSLMGGCHGNYMDGKHYVECKEMRNNYTWGGSMEMCALSCLTGNDVVVYYLGGYYKFGYNKSSECFFFYNPGGHYDVILQP